MEPELARIAADRMEGRLPLRAAVMAVVARIPAGKVLGYGHVAALIGSPRAARQVGYALAALRPEQADPEGPGPIPWWRVIRSDGSLAHAGDPGRPLMQRALLQDEGVPMATHHWRPD
jgi:methylated-DNA-protein-cysteine methyltransferase related protein